MSFNPSVWPISNRRAMYVITVLLCLFGYLAYNNLAKEQFPEIKFPQIIVQTVYPGTSPANMENLVTKPLEKQLKNLSGIKKVTSNSFQDFSVIIAEFNTDVEVPKAKLDVQDAVDKAKADPNGLPKGLPQDPTVKEIDVSELPIMYVNISGNYDFARLENYSDKIKERIESLKEVKRVEVVGGLDREIQVNVDLYKMQAAQLSFRDIQGAIAYENIEATPGQVAVDGEQRILSIKQTFASADDIANVVIKNPFGAEIILKDIAEVKDTYKDQESYARLNGKNVITLNIIKAGGQNLIEATDKIYAIVNEMTKADLPSNLDVVITGEQADATRTTLHDLINTIIIGFILVVVILMFFMGTTNAIFVGLSVPLSCAIAFMVLSGIGFTLNMIVLFAFLLALGIVVDDAVVVIENAHRILHDEDLSVYEATKKATSEVFWPVLTGTITTLMPFIPLAFWKGTIGEFMFFLPVTLIIALLASLVVAYVFNPVFAVSFMKKEDHHHTGKASKIVWDKGDSIAMLVFAALAIIGHVKQAPGFGNFMLVMVVLYLLNKYVFSHGIRVFQTRVWPSVIRGYLRLLTWALNHKKTVAMVTIGLLIGSFALFAVRSPKVVFFPESEPNFAYVYLSLPEGTEEAKTNEVLQRLENKVYQALDIDLDKGRLNPLVKSVISNVKVGATDQQSGEVGEFGNRGKITVSFVKFAERNGKSTQALLDKIRSNVKEIPGAKVTVDKERGGPPTAKPILIELTGEKLEDLIAASKSLKRFIDNAQVEGVEELKSDFQANKPELQFKIDRTRISTEGISTGQITQDLRTAMFGMEVSRFKDANDDYPIMVRLKKEQRNNIDLLRNLQVTYRDFGMGGMVRNVPISSFGTIEYSNTFGGIKRKDEKRIITLSSNVLSEYNPNEVVAQVENVLKEYKAPSGINIRMGGEQEEQKETGIFLGTAMGISILLIVLLLMIQFNSLKRMLIILSEILLSIIGVLLGFAFTKMEMSIIMTGIGIVALAGIVVRNGILLVEFFDVKLAEGYSVRNAVLEAGRTRMTPVLLTATATMLGLVPLAVGLNIDFAKLFATGNPNLFFGGDSVAFWGPLSWTMIFGLSFATFLTLILVPVMLDAFIRGNDPKPTKINFLSRFRKPKAPKPLAKNA
jgi:multidrug efflux pump